MNLTQCINSSLAEDTRLVTHEGMRAVYNCIADYIIGVAVGLG